MRNFTDLPLRIGRGRRLRYRVERGGHGIERLVTLITQTMSFR